MSDREVNAFLDHFHWMVDPSVDPLRTKIREFFIAYLDSKGSGGGTTEEGQIVFAADIAVNPESWPATDERLAELWLSTTKVLNKLPAKLSRPAQLIWLGIQAEHENDFIDAALLHEFPVFTPHDEAKAWREAANYMRDDANHAMIQQAVFRAWHDIEKAKGRPEHELVFGECLRALDVVVEQDGGGRTIEFNRLQLIRDPELRKAVLGAARNAHEERLRE